ncbi:MAG: type II toxin-antitoxin system PemK/MazF family toxin [Candidatus Schekmanbacteria bacterium]|nr:type II toxin-antitoxin system PemK/MazF family toxin [Candidatus Schekmanbacteria bacterium]
MRPKKWEVWVANLNPQLGTEQGKTRPVVVVQTDLLNECHPSTIICPITTNVESKSDILRVHLADDEGGLNQKSDILVDQIRAIDNCRFIKKIGIIYAPSRQKLINNIGILLDINQFIL